MNETWPVQDAKAKFSEFLRASLANGPQIVTNRGVETAVLIPIEEAEVGEDDQAQPKGFALGARSAY